MKSGAWRLHRAVSAAFSVLSIALVMLLATHAVACAGDDDHDDRPASTLVARALCSGAPAVNPPGNSSADAVRACAQDASAAPADDSPDHDDDGDHPGCSTLKHGLGAESFAVAVPQLPRTVGMTAQPDAGRSTVGVARLPVGTADQLREGHPPRPPTGAGRLIILGVSRT